MKAADFDPNDPASIKAMTQAQRLYEQQRANEKHNRHAERRRTERRRNARRMAKNSRR